MHQLDESFHEYILFVYVLFDSVCISVCEMLRYFSPKCLRERFFLLYVSYHRNTFLVFLNLLRPKTASRETSDHNDMRMRE